MVWSTLERRETANGPAHFLHGQRVESGAWLEMRGQEVRENGLVWSNECVLVKYEGFFLDEDPSPARLSAFVGGWEFRRWWYPKMHFRGPSLVEPSAGEIDR
jgi:hypothetical protein